MSLMMKCVLLSIALLALMSLATPMAQADTYDEFPYYYHHYRLDRSPGNQPAPQAYTYDPYPMYRAYTHANPPFYGQGGYSKSNPYGMNWGLYRKNQQAFHFY